MKHIIILLLLSTSVYAGNWGHRASGGKGEYHSFLPENSMIALKAGLVGYYEDEPPIQENENYTYLEFDVQETRDGHLVVFHDKTVSRMIPYGQNEQAYDNLFDDEDFTSQFKKGKVKFKKLKIIHFNLDELKTLRLAGKYDQSVPTLDEFLEGAEEYNLKKPIIVEIKHLHTEKAKRQLFYTVKDFRDVYMDNIDIKVERDFNFPETTAFLAFSKKYKANYGSKHMKEAWCLELKELGFKGIFQAKRHSHNFCAKYYDKKKKKSWWHF